MSFKALALFSGSLDSQLAVHLATRAGLAVRAIHIETGFARDEHRRVVAEWGHTTIDTIDLADTVLGRLAVASPSADPCLVVRELLLGELARAVRGQDRMCIVTGEVLGQRASGQNHADFERLDREAGLVGRVLRPLSAQLLPATLVESEGGVARERLGRIHGRSRRGQFALAEELGLEGYPTPSGACCWLADRGLRRRLADLLRHGQEYGRRELELLRFGRQFRLGWQLKAVLSRDRAEGERLAALVGPAGSCQVADGRGSLVLLEGQPAGEALRDAAALAARYSQRRGEARVMVSVRRAGRSETVEVAPASDEQLAAWRL